MVSTNPAATDRRAPIGVFDSGIGGLTVVREIMRQLPHETLIYFGDTARVPYGPKSPDTVRRYSREIATFLADQGVKAIVVACNTATAHALPELRAEIALPVIGVVEPGAMAAVEATRNGSVGVIATFGTIFSGAYERAIRQLSPNVTITTRACPLFVPLVEEGWLDTEATRLIAREYLSPLVGARIDTLVLGCTHYPLLKPMLAEVLGDGVQLIDSAEQTAVATARVLATQRLETPEDTPEDTPSVPERTRAPDTAAAAEGTGGNATRHRFIASDAPAQFLQLGQRFLGSTIDRVETITLG
ncbi:MAG: glutamate racemase [Gemmatimonadaceae bacterium]